MKFTPFGVDVVTSRVEEPRASVPATPSAEFDPNRRDIPVKATLKRFAVPESAEPPVNDTVPAVAVSEPLTSRFVATEKLAAVVMLPGTLSALKASVPVPLLLIVLEEPFKVTVPPDAENVPAPLADKLPFTVNDVPVLTEPVIFMLSNVIPVPPMVFDMPLIVTTPPEACVNVPDPVVRRFPPMAIDVVPAAFTPEPVIVRLLRLFDPVPLMIALVPLMVTVPVPPFTVPLFVQLPPTPCENDPPLNVVELPMETFPFTVIPFKAVKETDVPPPSELVRFPAIVIALAGILFVAAPVLLLNVRLPYDSSDTV